MTGTAPDLSMTVDRANAAEEYGVSPDDRGVLFTVCGDAVAGGAVAVAAHVAVAVAATSEASADAALADGCCGVVATLTFFESLLLAAA